MIPNVISVGDRLTLRHCHTSKFKAGMLSVSLVLPIQRESAYLTSLLLSVLLRGTERYPTVSELNRRLDYLYGTELSIRNFYRGDCQIVGMSADLVDDAYLPPEDGHTALLDDALEVMRQILFHPVLDADGRLDAAYVESEKQLQCDAIRAKKNHPQSYAAECCRSRLYQEEPCGIPIYGTEAEVRAVTPQMLTAHWRGLLSELRLDCFYVGRADAPAVTQALRLAFAEELSSCVAEPFSDLRMASTAPAKAETLYCEETFPSGQGHLVLGIRTGITIVDRLFYACTLFNELLGVSPVSRLFMNVREKLSLCYSCNSVYNSYKGTILISCGLKNENRMRAEQEILLQLQVLAEGRWTEDEWIAAKQSIENAYCQLEDSPTALESFYFGRALTGVKEALADCRRGFSAVTREEVMEVAHLVRLDTVFFLRQTGETEEDEHEDD